ncbi:MAG: 2-oxo acid dehydrogenase subunit E2 [Deltaproteobacteria bacterium]|nr:2-oxo acid dehydrogenase subunit E2 [Deltaproteobacteria bacterium]MBI3065893.1 2-oxo acid dehydrogenase subunit E2 [Deltaproteobacteria bacterium]
MLHEFKFPDVGEGIAEGEIVRWLVKEGDWVKEDQDLVEVETDKAVLTLNSPYTGKIETLHGNEGEIIKVGALLTTIREEAETASAAEAARKDSGTVVGSLAEAIEVVRPVLATPAVRALARQMMVDLAGVKGTGPGGRITKEDVEKAAGKIAAQPGAAADSYGPVERIPLRGIRRTVAKRMAEASKHVAEVTIWEDADITELEQVRAKQREAAEQQGVKLTYLPFLIKASIAALKAHPYFNATLDEETQEIILKKYYNLGIAVDTSDGLIVFVIKEADQKSILDLARETAALAEKARLRKIDLPELRGSTFTITNYGVVGASYGTPIINHPEVAILGLGKIEDRAVVRGGQIVVRKIMPLSLAFDHRVIDGVEAGRFLGVVIQHLVDPALMHLEGK